MARLDVTYDNINVLADMHWAVQLTRDLATTLATRNPWIKAYDAFASSRLR